MYNFWRIDMTNGSETGQKNHFAQLYQDKLIKKSASKKQCKQVKLSYKEVQINININANN